MPIVYVNIGSNLGERERLINKAIEEIGNLFGYYGKSSMVESKPWGFDSTNCFLNVGVVFKTGMDPEKLLKKLQEIERQISSISHRDSEGNYVDREIDIDIMAFEEGAYNSGILQVPHKYLEQRDFFLLPLKELSPRWKHAISGKSIDDLLKEISWITE